MFKQVALVLTLVVLFAYAQHYDYNAVEAEDAMFYDNDNTNTMFWRRFKRAFSRVGRGFRSVGRGFRSMGHHMGRGFKKFGNTMKDWHDKSRMNQWISFVPGVGAVYDTSVAIHRLSKNPRDWRNWTDLGLGVAGFIPAGKGAGMAKHAGKLGKVAKGASKGAKGLKRMNAVRKFGKVGKIAPKLKRMNGFRNFGKVAPKLKRMNGFRNFGKIGKVAPKLRRLKAFKFNKVAPKLRRLKAFKNMKQIRPLKKLKNFRKKPNFLRRGWNKIGQWRAKWNAPGPSRWGKLTKGIRKSKFGRFTGRVSRGFGKWKRGVGKKWNNWKNAVGKTWRNSKAGRFAKNTGRKISRSRVGKAWRNTGKWFDKTRVGRAWNSYSNFAKGNKYLQKIRNTAKWIKRYRGAGNLSEAFGGKMPSWMKLNTRHRFYHQGGFARNWINGRRG